MGKGVAKIIDVVKLAQASFQRGQRQSSVLKTPAEAGGRRGSAGCVALLSWSRVGRAGFRCPGPGARGYDVKHGVRWRMGPMTDTSERAARP